MIILYCIVHRIIVVCTNEISIVMFYDRGVFPFSVFPCEHDNIRDFEKLPVTWLLLKNKTSTGVYVYIRRHLNGLPNECPNCCNCSIHALYFVVCKTYVFRERVNIRNLC